MGRVCDGPDLAGGVLEGPPDFVAAGGGCLGAPLPPHLRGLPHPPYPHPRRRPRVGCGFTGSNFMSFFFFIRLFRILLWIKRVSDFSVFFSGFENCIYFAHLFKKNWQRKLQMATNQTLEETLE